MTISKNDRSANLETTPDWAKGHAVMPNGKRWGDCTSDEKRMFGVLMPKLFAFIVATFEARKAGDDMKVRDVLTEAELQKFMAEQLAEYRKLN